MMERYWDPEEEVADDRIPEMWEESDEESDEEKSHRSEESSEGVDEDEEYSSLGLGLDCTHSYVFFVFLLVVFNK